MSLSDCTECWSTPCTCGWDYRNYDDKSLREMKALFDAILEFRKKYPNIKLSPFGETAKSKDDKKFLDFVTKKINWL
jgi:hypothetical protein